MDKNTSKLEKIKSKYIFKKVFTFLCKFKKFELIINNKLLQNKLEVNIEDYKKESGRIVKIEKEKGILMEYISGTNILLYEGEFLNGKKNGKGKEYYINGKLKFEGEYLKGKKVEGIGYDIEGNKTLILQNDCKGKEYYNKGKIKFDGEYFNGKRWKGIGYDYQGNKIFEMKYGKGKCKDFYFNGNLFFEGEYFNGKKNGKGKEFSKDNKLIFEGEYLNDLKIKGNGFDNEGYKFLIIDKDGQGIEYYDNGIIQFKGKYLDGKRWAGKGKEYDSLGQLAN